jgi:hypothetical protein
MANEDMRYVAAAPPPPADSFGRESGGTAQWIRRARAFNRERAAWAAGSENSNEAAARGR